MKLSDFNYILPPKQIAQTPAEPRDSSKLMILDRNNGQIQDKIFSDISGMLGENDVLVVNKTRVIKARLKGIIGESEKKCEIFLHKQIKDSTWDCLVYPGKKLKPETVIHFSGTQMTGKIQSISEKGRIVEFTQGGNEFLDTVEGIGESPLPPYIKDSESPSERYQTVYNDKEKSGSVAAPTAGLHFTAELLEKLEKKGVIIEKVLLHVGLGTFANVEIEDVTKHHMHSEYIEIDKETAQRLNQYKASGKRIIAVGTTSVRTLESMSDSNGQMKHGNMDTQIFIYPGYEWKFVDSIITNFHLPQSTLLMLVSSFASQEIIKKAYEHAVESDYRFFSFGDAMWID
ncbi:tRNA preQ1(34) S-adenosylmethionine ribosyltransferase-isomerase QueA [Candidatus Gracilibacteria bacterium]|nr:tRNA preQ1(34) S-adenosylmethionine ribosyltransferase-isomerase QueA [Candidatus Gracilibacteria bacterium]